MLGSEPLLLCLKSPLRVSMPTAPEYRSGDELAPYAILEELPAINPADECSALRMIKSG